MMTALSLETIGALSGGRGQVSIAASINAALRDVEDRGDDEKSRKVVIQLEFRKLKPGANQVCIDLDVKTVLPPYAAGVTIAELTFKPGTQQVIAEFRDDSPERPDQPSMFGEERRRRGGVDVDGDGEQ